MKACPKCNFENQDEGKFCAQCGEPLAAMPVAEMPAEKAAVEEIPAAEVPTAEVQLGAPVTKKKKWVPIVILLSVFALLGLIIGILVYTHVICLEHKWRKATCDEPKTCFYCGKTEGEELGHKYDKATCDLPETCSRCSETRGEALSHKYSKATCTQPQKCSECGKTNGVALGHSIGSWTTSKSATLTSTGKEVRECTVCSAVLETRTTSKKTPGVVNGTFNFTDAEFIAWYNTKVNSYVSSVKLDVASDTVTGYRVTTQSGVEGVLILSHKDSIYGNITAITFAFDESSTGWAHAAHVGTNISTSFTSDSAAYYYARNSSYSAGGMTLLKLDIGTEEDMWTIAPTAFVYGST